MPSFDADAVRRDNPLSEYLPRRGVRLTGGGAEWSGCCPFHSENTPSFTVYRGRKGTQEFHCFGCDAKGDVIDFVQRFDSVGFTEACEILGGTRDEVRREASPVPVERVDIYAAWVAKLPPGSAPPIVAGKRTGPIINPKNPDKPPPQYTPKSVYPYRLSNGQVIGYVLRVEIRGRKLTPLVLWCENTETGEVGWCHRPFTGPRRLYNLPALAERPDAQVLVVEGEKCADAAGRLLPSIVATTWQGGGKAAGKADWSPARGRDVLIWPDNDPEGLAAAQEAGRLCTAAGAASVRVIAPPGEAEKKGWDIADAEEAGWTKADVLKFARARARPWTAASEPAEPEMPIAASEETPPVEQERPPAARRPALKTIAQEKIQEDPEPAPDNVVPLRAPRRSRSSDWMQHLELDQNNSPIPKIMKNIVGFMAYHPRMVGVIARDVFANEIVIKAPPPWIKHEGEWKVRPFTDADIVSAVSWLDEARMRTNVSNVTQAIIKVAEDNKFDPVREHFDSLKWDGIKRLHTGPDGRSWLEKYIGVRPISNGIERAFGMRWMISAVARNLTERVDGEKVDTMLVLEGQQGMLKSTALEVLATMGGHRYFAEGISDIVSKDGIMQMQGSVIVEFDELAAINKADTETIKSFLSRKTDKIRLPYAKSVTDLRRRFVTAGTMNPRGMGYLKDPTGARRFWPVTVIRPADIAALTADRDQLWAEAVHLYRAGEPWWLQGSEVEHAEIEQKRRFQADPWADQLNEWLNTALGDVTVAQAFRLLSVPAHLQNDAAQQRVVSHLIANGWVRTAKKVGNGKKIVFVKAVTND